MSARGLRTLRSLEAAIASCRACPRLVAWREQVAREKRRAYRDEAYWGRPVPGFGDPRAKLLIVGLAPGAHGANRTGRMFTGDRSGDFLYAALHRAGLASQPTSERRGDGLELDGAFITAPCRCAPPDNKPLPEELIACRPFLDAELALLKDVRAVLALGRIAWDAALFRLGVRAEFAHGATAELPKLGGRAGATPMFASYHVSQQNTQTGRLTEAMFDAVLARATTAAGLSSKLGA